MRIARWIARLREQLDGLDVHGAAELAALKSEHRRDAVYVAPLAETALGPPAMSTARQTVRARVAVALAIRNLRSPRGEAGASDLEAARAQVRRALLGWQPPDGWGPAEFASGRLLTFADGVIWWQDEYEADYLIGDDDDDEDED